MSQALFTGGYFLVSIVCWIVFAIVLRAVFPVPTTVKKWDGEYLNVSGMLELAGASFFFALCWPLVFVLVFFSWLISISDIKIKGHDFEKCTLKYREETATEAVVKDENA